MSMASYIQTSEAWRRARDRYIEDLDDEEQQRYFKASPKSLLDDASAAETSHDINSTTRRVMEKLQPFVTAIEQYGEAIDVFSSTYSLALGPIWGSIKVLLHIAREYGKYFDKLVDMFARIGDVLPRFRTYERLFSNHEHLIEALSEAYLNIIIFCSDAKAVFRRGQKSTLKVMFKMVWKPFEQQFGQQLSAFRQHQKNVEKEAGLANMIEAADARAVMHADQKELKKRRREDNRIRILAMLNAVDYEAKHTKLKKLRHPRTSEWIFRQALYEDWKMSGPKLSLFSAGCGKSILASNLIDNLMSAVPVSAAPASDVIYYYCDYADKRILQLDRILGSLLNQLFLHHQIPEHIELQLLQIYAGGTRSPSEKALGEILCSSIALRTSVYIVFDGTDECEKSVWQEILKIFRRLAATRQCNVKIFLTCVEEGHVAHHLHYAPCVKVSPTATAEDIEAFVTASVRSKVEDGDLRIRNPELEQAIISELVLKANGMFLWVFFQLDDLCDSTSDAMIRETLKNLPEGLGNTYRRILINISKTAARARMARKIFNWATVAKRPLFVEELKEAVAFEPDDTSWNVDKIPHEDPMFESCRGLIIKDQYDETARFAHHTVRQYLTGGLTTKVDPFFEVSLRQAENLAGQTCVAYLSFSDFETQITSTMPTLKLAENGVLESGGPLWIPSILGIRRPIYDLPYRLLRGHPAVRPSDINYWKHLGLKPKPTNSPSTDLREKYQLLCYAIDFWEPHTRSCESSDPVLCRRLETLAMEKNLLFDFRPWGDNQHFGPYGCVGCPRPSLASPVAKDLPLISMVHYAAEVGNFALLKPQHSSNFRITDYLNHERYHQETLLIACRHNRINIAKFLIENGKYDLFDGRAVNVAAAAGHAELLRYLISFDQYLVRQHGQVPFDSAAENGHDAVVEVLAGAGVNLQAVDQLSLQAIIESAATNGHDSVIRTLLQRGKHSITNYIGTSAFRIAAANGHLGVMRALGEFSVPRSTSPQSQAAKLGRDVPPYFDEFLTAVKCGELNILERFIPHTSLDSIREAESGWTPLHIAAAEGHEKVIRWLSKQGADVTATDLAKQTALHVAVHRGHDNAICCLVEMGADIFATDWDNRVPLFYATKLLGLYSVHALLESGVEVGKMKSVRGEALHSAAGRETLLHVLLDKIRDDVNHKPEYRCKVISKALTQACTSYEVAAIVLVSYWQANVEIHHKSGSWKIMGILGKNSETGMADYEIVDKRIELGG